MEDYIWFTNNQTNGLKKTNKFDCATEEPILVVSFDTSFPQPTSCFWILEWVILNHLKIIING